MKVSSFVDLKKKYKNATFRWKVIELYRLGLVSEAQVLDELKISATAARPNFPAHLEPGLSALPASTLLSQTQTAQADEKEDR